MIRFSNPAALWFLISILPLVLLYILKRKRREIVVPSTLLWKQALEDARAQTPFQKLRSNLLLWLQILAIVLIVAILSGPHVLFSSQASGRWILVLDVSASMQSTDERPSRFEAAREKLLDVLDRIPAPDEVLLVSAGADSSVLHSFTRDHTALRAKLLAAHPEDTAGNWKRLRTILQPLTREEPAPHTVIASDFAGFPPGLERTIPFAALKVGSAGDNIAITHLALEPVPAEPSRQALFYRISNFFSHAMTVEGRIEANGELVDAYLVPIPGGGSAARTLQLNVVGPEQIVLTIAPDDPLPLDNRCVVQAEPRGTIDVRVLGNNPYLLKALRAIPSVSLQQKAEIIVGPAKGKDAGGLGPGIFFIASVSGSSSRVAQWNDSHPVLRYVDPGIWHFLHSSTLSAPPGSAVLLETTAGPAAYATDHDGRRNVVFGFSLEDSNLPMLAAFPVVLQNSIEWIDDGLSPGLSVVTGEGRTRAGAFSEGGRKGYANFVSEQESRIRPENVRSLPLSGTQQVRLRRDLSTWFLILLTAIVLLEWCVFHRRPA